MKKLKTNPRRLILIPVLFYSLSLVPTTQAVTPSPDGGYPGGNTAEGQQALLSLTTGTYNTAVGLFSLSSNTEGDFNTAIGAGTLLFNTSFENTATGGAALLNTTIGDANTANGAYALVSNIDGSDNTAMGDQALFSNVTGDFNTAIGVSALVRNTGDSNTATGAIALVNNTQGQSNTAIGASALPNNSSGSGNTGLGFEAGSNVTTANNVICIGTVGGENIDNSCFIGNIQGAAVDATTAASVFVDAHGKLGTLPTDANGRRATIRDPDQRQTMLNEFLKQQRRITDLEGAVAHLAATVKEQAAQIHKVSAQFQVSKRTPDMVVNNP